HVVEPVQHAWTLPGVRCAVPLDAVSAVRRHLCAPGLVPPRRSALDVTSTTHVVLVYPEIHWNTGNAGRTCLAAGATLHLIKPLGFSLDEREVKRAGLDYWEFVDVRVWSNWEAFEQELPSLGTPYFFSTKATQLLWDAPLGTPENIVLIFGR